MRSDLTEARRCDNQGMRYDLAKAILASEMGRCSKRIRNLPNGDDAGRERLRAERAAIFDLRHGLDIHDAERVTAILARDIEGVMRGFELDRDQASTNPLA